MRYAWMAVIVVVLTGLASSSPPDLSREKSRSAAAKLERISTEAMESGETIILTEDEINSFLLYDYPEMPEGVRDLQVRLVKDTGIAHAFVDLSKLQSSGDSSFATFWLAVFRGERELKAACRYTSADGQAVVELESAELDGRSIPKPILDWLVSTVLAEHIEGVELGKPTPLPHKLRQIRIEPGQAVITAY
jgi:hypothetical protein